MKRVVAMLGLLLLQAAAAAQPPPRSSDGRVAPDGVTEVQIDLPDACRRENIGSPAPRFPGDRRALGCCVFTSTHHTACWQNIPALQEMPKWMVDNNIPGGGDPEKVDQLVDRICKERGLPKPAYVHVKSNNLDILAAAVNSGRMVCNTYAWSKDPKRYGGQRIYHMVNTVAARVGPAKMWAVLDNNFPTELEWLTEAEYLRTYSGGRTGWAMVFLPPPPPPPPANRRAP